MYYALATGRRTVLEDAGRTRYLAHLISCGSGLVRAWLLEIFGISSFDWLRFGHVYLLRMH